MHIIICYAVNLFIETGDSRKSEVEVLRTPLKSYSDFRTSVFRLQTPDFKLFFNFIERSNQAFYQ
jgi:hypothetical protein